MSRTRTGAPARSASPATRDALTRELRALTLYLGLAVVLALVLGLLRAFVVAPRYGAAAADALGTPWAGMALLLAGCYLAQRFILKLAPAPGVGGGLTALVLILAVQFVAALPS